MLLCLLHLQRVLASQVNTSRAASTQHPGQLLFKHLSFTLTCQQQRSPGTDKKRSKHTYITATRNCNYDALCCESCARQGTHHKSPNKQLFSIPQYPTNVNQPSQLHPHLPAKSTRHRLPVRCVLVAAWLAAMYSMNTQWLRLDTAFIAVASHARASLARAISAAALAASDTGSRLAPMTTVWPPAASCLMAFASLMRPASGLLPAPSASRSLRMNHSKHAKQTAAQHSS
jgi:hypothetical protein